MSHDGGMLRGAELAESSPGLQRAMVYWRAYVFVACARSVAAGPRAGEARRDFGVQSSTRFADEWLTICLFTQSLRFSF